MSDVNGTRFHLLLGQADWESRASLNTSFGFNRNQELTLATKLFAFTPSPGNHPVDVSGRRGAAADAHGNVYWIAANGTELLVHAAATRVTSHFWSSLDGVCAKSNALFAPVDTNQPAQPIALQGLAVTTHHYLVAGTIEPAGLLVFDLQRGGEPRQYVWPVAFAPFDLVAAHDGGLWILDRTNARAWRLDRTMSVVPQGGPAVEGAEETFQPVDGSGTPRVQPSSIALDMALALNAADAIAIEVLPDDSILLLDGTNVLRVTADGTHTTHAIEVQGHDFAIANDLLYIAGREGDQAIAYELEQEPFAMQLVHEFYPMRLFGAKALIAAPEGPLYDAQERWVPLIAQPRPRYETNGTLVIGPLDGKEPDCVWHRLMIDACIPPECSIRVETRASNDPARFDDWSQEPALLRRPTGSELAWSDDTRGAGIHTWELLFQRAKGRYLEIRLELKGTGRGSPRIRALRAWYPRFSYLDHYLPAVYRENEESASFLDRFLANVEGFFTNIEDRIAASQALLDVDSAPPETLEWLASWMDIALDPAWDEQKRRLFLRHAAVFFEWRGTVPGLMMSLRLLFDECVDESIFDVDQPRLAGPRIVESFRTRKRYAPVAAISAPGLPLQQVQAGASAIPFVQRGTAYLPLWQATLQRRYTSIAALNRAWLTSYKDWADIPLFSAPPQRGAALSDWSHFEGLVVPARDTAHRFTIFLPQSTLGADASRIDLARRVIALEKPAHTTFDVKFYWAFFRVGEARLGEDTVVDLGSRSPELLSPFVLDRNYLGSGWIGPAGGCR